MMNDEKKINENSNVNIDSIQPIIDQESHDNDGDDPLNDSQNDNQINVDDHQTVEDDTDDDDDSTGDGQQVQNESQNNVDPRDDIKNEASITKNSKDILKNENLRPSHCDEQRYYDHHHHHQISKSYQQKNLSAPKSVFSLKSSIFTGFIAIVAAVVYVLSNPIKFPTFTSTPDDILMKYQNDINEFINDTREMIPDSGEDILRYAIEQSIRNTNEAIILLLIGHSDQSKQLEKISTNLAKLRIKIKENNDNDDVPMIKLNQHFTPSIIEDVFHENFITNQRSVLILEHLQLLQADAIRMFHQFVDDDQSKIPGAFAIITLEYDSKQNLNYPITMNTSLKQMETYSTQLLKHLWSTELRQETLDCLINRMAEYSIFLLSK